MLSAFGILGHPLRLPGGRGRTYATAHVVLKPVDDEAEAHWIADLVATLETRRFRLPRPIAATDGRWTIDGWSAWTRVVGAHSTTRWPELLDAAAAFHEALTGVGRPEFIDRRTSRWAIADRIAWDELSWTEFQTTPHVDRLVAARRPLDLPSQLVHGDFVGNVLFADGLPPAIIDLSLYWRPRGYSAALVVGDALAWEDAPPSVIQLIEEFPEWRQFFLRAVIFRVVVNELARRVMPWRADLSEHYRAVVDLAISLATREGRSGTSQRRY